MRTLVPREEPLQPRLLGAPLPGNIVELRDANEGGIGEIWIGGPQVGLGYLNNKETTAERFVAEDGPGGQIRFLKTGDFARQTAHGLELLGRKDFMVGFVCICVYFCCCCLLFYYCIASSDECVGQDQRPANRPAGC